MYTGVPVIAATRWTSQRNHFLVFCTLVSFSVQCGRFPWCLGLPLDPAWITPSLDSSNIGEEHTPTHGIEEAFARSENGNRTLSLREALDGESTSISMVTGEEYALVNQDNNDVGDSPSNVKKGGEVGDANSLATTLDYEKITEDPVLDKNESYGFVKKDWNKDDVAHFPLQADMTHAEPEDKVEEVSFDDLVLLWEEMGTKKTVQLKELGKPALPSPHSSDTPNTPSPPRLPG